MYTNIIMNALMSSKAVTVLIQNAMKIHCISLYIERET